MRLSGRALNQAPVCVRCFRNGSSVFGPNLNRSEFHLKKTALEAMGDARGQPIILPAGPIFLRDREEIAQALLAHGA